MKLLLDEHFRPQIAHLLRERGHDAVALLDREDLTGMLDAQLWKVAISEGRAVVTANARDFVPEARATNATGRSHTGLVLVPPKTVLLSRDATGFIVDALHRIASANRGEPFVDRVAWVQAPAEAPEEDPPGR